jgi:PKD repeat protein
MDLLDSASHVYGDNGNFDVTLTVEDDDGGVTSIIINVIVRNVAPFVEVEAFMYVDLTLRIAGEKYHSVGIHLKEDGEDVLVAMVTRRPGNPDEQTGSILGARIDVTKTYTVLIDYLPNDPRVNGNVWGANPVWIDVGFEDGTVNRLHHTFNVRKSYWNSTHWNHIDPWEVELNPLLLGHNITLEARATDPGSDDLIFKWDFGDGTTAGPTTYYNNDVSPDPYPSPEINPMTATDTCVYSYTTAGTYTITLVVEDDDGGITVTTLDIGF